MKKIVNVMAIMLVLIMAVVCLSSCGKTLSGEYKESVTGNIVYKFSGSRYTKTVDNFIGDDTVVEGKYEIDEEAGKITFTYEVDGEEKTSTENFVEGEENDVKYIKIGIVKYNKK